VQNISYYLRAAGLPLSDKTYLRLVLALSIGAGSIAAFFSPDTTFLVIPVLLLAGLFLPRYLALLRTNRAEAELPLFLRSVSTAARLEMSPLDVLLLSSEGLDVIKGSIERVASLYAEGIPLKEAVKKEAATFLSPTVQRGLMAAVEAAENRVVEPLERQALALIQTRRLKNREFSGKLSMLSLLFVAVTAIVPAMLLSYSVLMPVIFGEQPDTAFINTFLFAVVPLTSAAVLLYMGLRV
jgi:hypothetical protein